MAKKSETEYRRQGGINDENFIYLFKEIEDFGSIFTNGVSSLTSAVADLNKDMYSIIELLVKAVGNVGNSVVDQTNELKTDLSAIATAINEKE